MKIVPIHEVVDQFKKISATEFGGKLHGRFKISYQRLQQISGRIILSHKFIDELKEQSFIAGITVINLGHEFAVIETTILSGYRNVPQGVIEKILKTEK